MNTKRTFQAMLVSLLALSLFACEFGDANAGASDYTRVSNEEARPLPDVFKEGMAINYSGYRVGQSPGKGIYPSEADIRSDIELLGAMGFRALRLFDTSTHAERVLKVVQELNENRGAEGELDNMQVMLGVWISGPRATYNGKNMGEVNRAIEWATGEYKDQIAAVSVGNECMVDWNTFGWATPPADIAHYVSYVRNRIEQPVTVDDNWEAWSLENENGKDFYSDVRMVAEAVDFISLHTYPIADAKYDLWDWRKEDAEDLMDAALERAKENYGAARAGLAEIGISKPIVVGETGWQSTGALLAHPVNQAMYYQRMNDWVYGADPDAPEACFFFSASDEPWKGDDDNWGLFTAAESAAEKRAAKYVVYSSSDERWKEALDFYRIPDADADNSQFDPGDAVAYVPPAELVTVGESEFVVFADSILSGAYNGQLWDSDKDGTGETENMRWEAWENNSTAGTNLENVTANAEDNEGAATTTVAVITPVPADWGWGMMALMHPQGYNLSAFASGYLKFRIKTEYSGKLEVGIQTGLGADNDGQDMLIVLDPDNNTYGYDNNNGWKDLSIPIDTLTAAVQPSYGVTGTVVGIEKVYVPFVIADRHDKTEDGSHDAAIWVDNIRWTMDE